MLHLLTNLHKKDSSQLDAQKKQNINTDMNKNASEKPKTDPQPNLVVDNNNNESGSKLVSVSEEKSTLQQPKPIVVMTKGRQYYYYYN